MIKARFGADFDRVVRRVFPFIERIRVHPDVLTLLGALAALLAGAAFAFDRLLVAGLLLMVSGFFDLIDGVVARQQGKSSTAGAFFDSTVDRFSDLVSFSGIVLGATARADVGEAGLGLWALGGSLLTSYTRASAEKHVSVLNVGFMERGERFALLILGALCGFMQAALLLIALGSTWTAVQRLMVGRRVLQLLDQTGLDPTLSGDEAPADRGRAHEEVPHEG